MSEPEPEVAARLGFAVWRFWQQRGYLNEARERLTAMRQRDWELSPVVRARLCEAAGGVHYWQADPVAAAEAYAEALRIWREIGDDAEIANALYNAAYSDLQPLMSGGVADEGRTGALLREALALFRAVGDRLGEANVMWGLGSLDYFTDRLADAEVWFVAALAAFRELGNRTMEAWALKMLESTLVKQGRVDEAAALVVPALHHFHEAGDLAGVTMLLDDLSAIAILRGDLPRAARLRGAARSLQAATGTELAQWVADADSTELAEARAALASAEFEREAAEGAAMPLDDVVAYALEESGPGPAG